MKRSDFFKRLGLGAAAVVIAPKVIAEALEEVKEPNPYKKYWDMLNDPDLLKHPRTKSEAYEWFEQEKLHGFGAQRKECFDGNRTTKEWAKAYQKVDTIVGPPELHKDGLIFGLKVKWVLYMSNNIRLSHFNGWFWYV